MKKYQSHKKVEAAKIEAIGIPSGADVAIFLEDGSTVLVPAIWLRKNEPEVGGYFVRYQDGYTSYSPRQVFEAGYREIRPEVAKPEPKPEPKEEPKAEEGAIQKIVKRVTRKKE